MSNLPTPSVSSNDFQDIFVDVIKGHAAPGYLIVEQGASFPTGLAVGFTNRAFNTLAPVLGVHTNDNRNGPLLGILHSQPAFRQGEGAYIEVQSNNTVVFRVRGPTQGNRFSAIVELPPGDYGAQSAPLLYIGANTGGNASKAGDRYPGALRMDTEDGERAITMWATYKTAERGRPIRRAAPRFVYNGDESYQHGRSQLVDQDQYEIEIVLPSFSTFKTILGKGTPPAEALAFIVELSKHLHRFRYLEAGKDNADAGIVENGIVLDDAPLRYVDGDQEAKKGSIDELTLFGDLVASVAHLNEQLTAERARNDQLQAQVEALTARMAEVEANPRIITKTGD